MSAVGTFVNDGISGITGWRLNTSIGITLTGNGVVATLYFLADSFVVWLAGIDLFHFTGAGGVIGAITINRFAETGEAWTRFMSLTPWGFAGVD